MPELPEVETTLRGVAPHVVNQSIEALTVSNGSLRWPVTEGIFEIVRGQRITGITRRAKYLLFELERGSMMVHLGMSGSLRLVDAGASRRKHDHIEMRLANGVCLRYHDPRRFGAWLWSDSGFPQLDHLGPEPLTDEFAGERLFHLSRKRKMAVKPFIMDNHIVVGVGNIYASEALFRSGIRPDRAAGRISLQLVVSHCSVINYWQAISKRYCRAPLCRGVRRCGTLLMAMVSRAIFSRHSTFMVVEESPATIALNT